MKARLAAVAVAAGVLSGCGGHAHHAWPLPAADLSGTRAAMGAIDSHNVARLTPRWRFSLRAVPSYSGVFASTPVADRTTVYVQDLRSNVFALDRSTGALRWTKRYDERNDGPNGLALAAGRVYGATDTDAFALDASTGHELLAPAPHKWRGAVRERRPGRLEGRRLPGHDRLLPVRARRDLRARCGHRQGALEVRDHQESVAPPDAGRRRRDLVPGLDRLTRPALRRDRESDAVGRHARVPERRRLPGPRALHRFVGRPRRAERPPALVRPGHAARRARLRLRGDADPGAAGRQGRRLRRRQGRARDRLGSADAEAAVGVRRRLAPRRSRPVAAAARDRLSRPARRGRDADGVRSGPPLRPGRRPLWLGPGDGKPGRDHA